MSILRNTFAVILGYATFVFSAVLLFQLFGIDPHADPSMGVLILVIVYGVVFSFAGGFLTQMISKTERLAINYVLAGLMAGFATFSLLKSTGSYYSQLAAIFLFAPLSALGGWTCLRLVKQEK
jgi:hypothetical protein